MSEATRTKDKPLAFCASHAKAHERDERDGAGWIDAEPLCPDCQFDTGYKEGSDDLKMAADARYFEGAADALREVYERQCARCKKEPATPNERGRYVHWSVQSQRGVSRGAVTAVYCLAEDVHRLAALYKRIAAAKMGAQEKKP